MYFQVSLLNIVTMEKNPVSNVNIKKPTRIHHSLGDGTSLMSLLLACTRQVAQPDLLPSIPGKTKTITHTDSVSTLEIIQKSPPKPQGLLDVILQGIMAFVYTNLFVLEFLGATLAVKDTDTIVKAKESAVKGVHKLVFTEAIPLEGISAIRRAVEGAVSEDNSKMRRVSPFLYLFLLFSPCLDNK